MKTVIKLSLAVLAFALVFCTFSTAQDTGANLFKAKCAMCHGPDGKGNTAMGKKFGLKDLGSAEVQKMSDADLSKTITDGKDKMPSYKGKLTDAQIDSLVKYIRTLKK